MYNYRRLDPSQPHEYDNLALIRAFSGAPSEAGFILVHVAMVRHSPRLVASAIQVLDACDALDRTKFDAGLALLRDTYHEINTVMETMWARSNPDDYLGFRTFIMGTKNQASEYQALYALIRIQLLITTLQPMFPNGVFYEGAFKEPVNHRGESGANDSMIPLGDNLLQISMPENPLTMVLRDFRTYRPQNHREFLDWVELRAKQVASGQGVKKFAYQNANSASTF